MIDIGSVPSPGADRTLTILEALFENNNGLTIMEIVRETDIAQNTAMRIAQTLEMRGYVKRHSDSKRFIVTEKLFNISSPSLDGKSLIATAYDNMCELRDLTGESIQILVKSNWKATVLEQVPGHHPVTVLGKVGMRIPIYSCAPGKAILSAISDSELENFFKETKLKKFTDQTLSTRKSLMAEITKAKKEGFTVDRSEGLEGIQCVAAPILDKHLNPVAAITVIGPKFRLTEDKFSNLGQQCINAARAIESKLYF